MKLRGRTCQCGGCGLYFGSTYAFDQHRKGFYDARYCLTAEEMAAQNWSQSDKGVWRTPGRADYSLTSRKTSGLLTHP